MSEISSSSASHNPSGLPQQFTFLVTRDEITEVKTMARRFAPDPRNGYLLQVQFGARTRRWVMHEHNVDGHLSFDDFEKPSSGWVTLSIDFIEFIAEFCLSEFEVTVEVDFEHGTVSASIPTTSTSVTLPPQRSKAYDVTALIGSKITIAATDFARMGRMLDCFPKYVDFDNLPDVLPFVNFTFDGKQLIARRDWSAFEGGEVSVTIPATGTQPRSFSCFSLTFPREMYFSDLHHEEEVTIGFSETTQHIAYVTVGNCGWCVEMGDQTTFKYRHALEVELMKHDFDVQADSRISWNSILQCSVRGKSVSIEIRKGQQMGADYFRLSTTVLDAAPWNLEVATEINDWNKEWNSVKLVREESSLIAVREVLASHIRDVPDAVKDLVHKSQIVSEVVGVLI